MSRSGLPEVARFWSQVDRSAGDAACWPWTRHLSTGGYARFGIKRAGRWRTVQGSRYGYELVIGPIREGLQLDHLCRNRCCVNPSHLEPVTNQENGIRGVTARGCARGHPWTPENSGPAKPGTARRRCRACHRHEARRRRLSRGITLKPSTWIADPTPIAGARESRLPARVDA